MGYLPAKTGLRGRGGTGRRAGFRYQWGNPWGFESLRPHQLTRAGGCRAVFAFVTPSQRSERGRAVHAGYRDARRGAQARISCRRRAAGNRRAGAGPAQGNRPECADSRVSAGQGAHEHPAPALRPGGAGRGRGKGRQRDLAASPAGTGRAPGRAASDRDRVLRTGPGSELQDLPGAAPRNRACGLRRDFRGAGEGQPLR